MPARDSLNVSLTPELAAWISAQVASGRYRSASEVVRAALRALLDADRTAPLLPHRFAQTRALMDEALRIDRDLARLVIESATEFAVIITDVNGIVVSWNTGAERLTGWTPGEAIGQAVAMLFTPEDRESGVPEGEMLRAREDGRAVDERWHLRRDGSRFWASGLLMPLRGEGAGTAQAFVKMMWDRTAEHAADQRFSAMTAALPGFVFVTDADGSNVETNAHFQTYTGLSAADLNGNRWLDVLHADDRARAAEIWAYAVATGETYEARYRFRRFDGEYRCFACRGVPERDEQGRVVQWLGTCIDVENETRARRALERLNVSLEHKVTRGEADLATAIEGLQAEIATRLSAEDALRQAQKMEAVGQLTGGVAHDFNNLLTIIKSSADLLRKPNLPEEKRQRYVMAIAETTERAAALTRQLLAFARRQPLQPEIFDAAARLRHLAGMVRTTVGSRVRVAVECADEGYLIEADPNQFDTALLNLVVNARDAMDGVGRLTLTVTTATGIPARRTHPLEAGEFVAVSVADTGTGIPPALLERVFEPFFTTKEVGKGTGLGLSQVIGFTKQSGGDVAVDSEAGRGTIFTLYLPRAEARTVVIEPQRPNPPVERVVGQCVLVVEDNQTVGEFAAQLLEELGYTTVWAANGQRALDLIAEEPHRFDAVFSDVVMPGMSGIELGERLRVEHPTLPVVLTSGYSHVLAQEGAHGFTLLHKPYSLEALSRTLRALQNAR